MELTRNFKQTVVERDPEFARALLDEEATLFQSGEPDHARYRTAVGEMAAMAALRDMLFL